MSQTTTDDVTDDGTDTTTDDSPSLTERVTAMRERLDSLADDDVTGMDDPELVELRSELKELERTVTDVLDDQTDPELESRIEPGDSLFGLRHIESHSKFVVDDPATVVARASAQGINWSEFVSVNATTLAKEHPDLAEIGRNEYTYLR